jgi:hypothetical protein
MGSSALRNTGLSPAGNSSIGGLDYMPSEGASRRIFWLILLVFGGLMCLGFLWAFWSAAPALSAIPEHRGDISRDACLACHLQGVNAPLMPHRDVGRCSLCHMAR